MVVLIVALTLPDLVNVKAESFSKDEESGDAKGWCLPLNKENSQWLKGGLTSVCDQMVEDVLLTGMDPSIWMAISFSIILKISRECTHPESSIRRQCQCSMRIHSASGAYKGPYANFA
jgi:hypothetical protein